MLIDTHCHLNFEAFDDVDAVIKESKKFGVGRIIIPGARVDSSIKAIEISKENEECWAAIGVHPHHFGDLINLGYEVLKNEIIKLASSPKVVAIGEIGIDYYHYPKTLNEDYEINKQTQGEQIDLFNLQLDIASKLNLPVIIHCREAFFDLLPILNSFLKSHSLRGVFHCFGGTREDLRRVLDLGFYIGFDGNITYKNSENLRELISLVPKDRILIETDSPYLSPLPFRGERNEPKNVKIVAETVAKCLNIDFAEVENFTTGNALKLFFNN